MKTARSGRQFFGSLILVLCLPLSLNSQSAAVSGRSVNSAAALRSLERAFSLLGAAEWQAAAFEAQNGANFDPVLADFPYIEALSLIASGLPRADAIDRLEDALSPGRFWRIYQETDAAVLCAWLYAETGRFQQALDLLSSRRVPDSADADYVRLLAYYGLGRRSEINRLYPTALDRWPFDSRFPRLFFIREKNTAVSADLRRIADTIRSRLYVWENDDRELLLLAVPFESDPEARVRNIRIYRGMGESDRLRASGTQLSPLSAVLALEYGLIDEQSAITEVFAYALTRSGNSGLHVEHLLSLSRFTGTPSGRELLSAMVSDFSGFLLYDANTDGIIDGRVLYVQGRPSEVAFDRNQDGRPDLLVETDFGAPARITVQGTNRYVVQYSLYPAVTTVTENDREYTLRPGSLRWAPVKWTVPELAHDVPSFFLYELLSSAGQLTETLLLNNSAYYRESDSGVPGGVVRVALEAGKPVSAEYRLAGKVYAWMTYENGVPLLRRVDHDGDGVLETTENFNNAGTLVAVLMDRNGNRKIEYREDYAADGTETLSWDTDEDGRYEIIHRRKSGGLTQTEWLHPQTGVPVIVSIEQGEPRSVAYGGIYRSVIRDPDAPVWWIRRIPDNSRTLIRKIPQQLNPEGKSVVSYHEFTEGNLRVLVVQTGGFVFAELLDE